MNKLLSTLFKKNDNTLEAVILFASGLLWGLWAEHSAILTLWMFFLGLIFLVANLDRRYHYLQALLFMGYGAIVFLIRPELWIGSVICVLCGLIGLTIFVFHRPQKNQSQPSSKKDHPL